MSFLLFIRRHCFALSLTALLGTSTCIALHYNQHYIGAVDWYGYYEEALLFKAARTTLPLELPVDEFPSVVPLGFNALPDGRTVPQYPPGYPLLLAAAMILKIDGCLMPLVGLASSLILFSLIRDVTGDKWTAGLYSVLWAFFPIVVYGSTFFMSDLVAALFVILSYWAYRRNQVFWSALSMVFALCIRPTNALYFLVFSIGLIRDRKLVRYSLCMLLPAMLYGYYNYHIFGAPWRTGYANVINDLSFEFFFPHLTFYLQEVFFQFGPLVLLLAIWGLLKPNTEKWFFLSWFGAFLVFYSFWRSGGSDRWWWTRFLLPGFAPLFVLSAQAFHRARVLLSTRINSGRGRILTQVALFAIIGSTPFYYIKFGLAQRDLWSTNKGYDYFKIVKQIEEDVPPGSYVGSVDFAGSFRLYTHLGSYYSMHPNAPKLVTHVLLQGHEAYLLVEPWNKNNLVVKELLSDFPATKVRDVTTWSGMVLYRLALPDPS